MPPTTTAQTADRIDRWIVALAVALAPLVLWRGSLEAFAVPKATVVWLAGAAVALVGLWRALQTGAVRRPFATPAHIALTVFLVLAVVATITGDAPWRSVLGHRGRSGGLATYLGGALLFVAAARALATRGADRLLVAVGLTGAAVATYGLVQRVGADPFTWDVTFAERTPFSTMGNTNFASGCLLSSSRMLAMRPVTSRKDRSATRLVVLRRRCAICLPIVYRISGCCFE